MSTEMTKKENQGHCKNTNVNVLVDLTFEIAKQKKWIADDNNDTSVETEVKEKLVATESRLTQEEKGRIEQSVKNNQTKWDGYLTTYKKDDLIQAIAHLTSDEKNSAATVKALREAIISQVEHRNSQDIIEEMRKLDNDAKNLTKITTTLTWVSAVMAVIGAILAAIQVWVAIKQPPVMNSSTVMRQTQTR